MRDLGKDMETCNQATRGPWHWTPEEIGCDAETGWWGEPPSVILPQVRGDDKEKGFLVWSNDDAEFIAEAREGWPHAIGRAIKAEAKFTECRKAAEVLQSEVERLTDLLDHYNAKCAICDYTTEITKLRKVADAAREFFEGTGCEPKECNKCGKCDPKYIGFCRWSGIGQALAELDKEGEI